MPISFYPESTAPLPFDQEQRSLVKILGATIDGGGGGGSTILRGSGNPNGVVTGSATSPLYIDTDTAQTWVWVSGTQWS